MGKFRLVFKKRNLIKNIGNILCCSKLAYYILFAVTFFYIFSGKIQITNKHDKSLRHQDSKVDQNFKNIDYKTTNFTKLPDLAIPSKKRDKKTTNPQIFGKKTKLIISEDFEDGKINLPISGNSPTVTKIPVRKGQYSMKTYLHCTESSTNYRTEVYVDNYAIIGDDYWYGFSIYLPDSYIPDRTWEIVAQWHGWPEGFPDFSPGTEYWRSPVLALRTTGGIWNIINRWDAKRNTGDINNRVYGGTKTWDLGKYETGKWVDWIFHFKWSYQNDGILEVWKNGNLVISKTGANCFNDKIGPYFKMGLYKGWENWWKYPSTNWWNHDVVDQRILYHDELRIAHGIDGYNLVSPDSY